MWCFVFYRKNWSPSWVVLVGNSLVFFKDPKSQTPSSWVSTKLSDTTLFFSTVKPPPKKPEGNILTWGKFMDCKMRTLWVIFECHSQFFCSMDFFIIESSPPLLLHKNILMLHTSVYVVGRKVTQTCIMWEQHPTNPVKERWKLMSNTCIQLSQTVIKKIYIANFLCIVFGKTETRKQSPWEQRGFKRRAASLGQRAVQ